MYLTTLLKHVINFVYKSILIVIGKFLELSTVWTTTNLKEEMAPSRDKTLAQSVWRTRQIGIFFAKINASWVFLVLVAPMSATYDSKDWKEEEFSFCVRNNVRDQSDEWVADDLPIQNLIRNIAMNFEKSPTYLAHVLIDMYWGWERYIAQIRNDIRGVCGALHNILKLDNAQA